ncbi:MAG: DegT/DnrJ/EryC1/StrS family aminotransferase, partial [Pedobacter sp.]
EIRMMELSAEYLERKEEIDQAIQQVLNSGEFIRGKAISQFEEHLSRYLDIRHVISCGNGTDALQIALMAIGICAGDEVIIPAFSYAAVAEVVCLLGAIPVFIDVDKDYFQLDDQQLEALITEKTKAIIPVHLFGQCANMDHVLAIAAKHHLYVIEDSAQAIGAFYTSGSGNKKPLGGVGHIGCTSFFPTKNLACYGDGGALLTNDPTLAEKIRMIANHGQRKRYEHEIIGVNSRLDTLQAAVLEVNLKHLPAALERKKEIAELYIRELSKGESTYCYLTGFGDTSKDYNIRIENRKTGASVRITDDQPIVQLAFWSIATVVCPEPYIRIKAEPGKEFAWKITYDYYVQPQAASR